MTRVLIRTAFATAALCAAGAPPCLADSDTLAPLSFGNFSKELRQQLRAVRLHDDVKTVGCLPGAADKRAVCTFQIGNVMRVMAASAKGDNDIVSVTMICTAHDTVGDSECLLGYAAGVTLTTPGIGADDRAKIIALLVQGLPIGNAVSLSTDERKYTLQKSVGLWFSIEAADAAEP